MESISLLLTMS